MVHRVFSPARLRKAREARGFSRTQLAAQIGVAYLQVVRYEQGRSKPSLDSLAAIADSCEITIDDLFDRVEVPQ